MSTKFLVKNQRNQPLPDTLLSGVSEENGNWQAMTDQRGMFTADLGDGSYDVTATKEGFRDLTLNVIVGPVLFEMQEGSTPIPPMPIPPTQGADAIDVSKAVMTAESPDVRNWPITTKLSELGLYMDDDMTLDFSKRNGPGSWPFVIGPEGGDIQYTIGVGCCIKGVWYLSTSILCISRSDSDNYVPTGPTLLPGQLPNNWYYYAGDPLATYQPRPGEQVAWFVASGALRRKDISMVQERSAIMLAPFVEGVYSDNGRLRRAK